jgi:hypothetical protein
VLYWVWFLSTARHRSLVHIPVCPLLRTPPFRFSLSTHASLTPSFVRSAIPFSLSYASRNEESPPSNWQSTSTKRSLSSLLAAGKVAYLVCSSCVFCLRSVWFLSAFVELVECVVFFRGRSLGIRLRFLYRCVLVGGVARQLLCAVCVGTCVLVLGLLPSLVCLSLTNTQTRRHTHAYRYTHTHMQKDTHTHAQSHTVTHSHTHSHTIRCAPLRHCLCCVHHSSLLFVSCLCFRSFTGLFCLLDGGCGCVDCGVLSFPALIHAN